MLEYGLDLNKLVLMTNVTRLFVWLVGPMPCNDFAFEDGMSVFHFDINAY